MRKFFNEFKAFIAKGNVFDMAVGLIIATAFNKIVTSMVNDIIMPLVTWATGANSLADLSVVLKKTIEEDGSIVELTWNYGNFLQTVIDFLIIAFSVFLMVKIVTASRKKLKELEAGVINLTKKDVKEDWKKARKLSKEQNRPRRVVFDELQAERKANLEAEAKRLEEEKLLKEAEDRKNNPTEIDLLKDIKELLKK